MMRPVNDLIKDAWQIYTKNWAFLVKALLVSIALVLPLVLGFIPPAAAAFAALFAKQKTFFGTLAIIFFLIFIILSFIIGSWSQTFIFQAIYQAGRGKQISMRKMLGLAWQKWPSFLIAHICSGLLIFLGLALLIIPGIILAVWFWLVSHVVVIEETESIDTLKRSKKLVEGYFLPALGRIALILFLSLLASSVFAKLDLAGAITNFLLSPLWLLMSYLIYQDLAKIRPASK